MASNSNLKKRKKTGNIGETEFVSPPQITPPAFLPPDFEPPTVRQATEVHNPETFPNEVRSTKKVRNSNLNIFLIIAAITVLIGGILIYFYWDSGSDYIKEEIPLVDKEIPADTIAIVQKDTVKPNAEKTVVPEKPTPKTVSKKEQPTVPEKTTPKNISNKEQQAVAKTIPVVTEKIAKGPSVAQLNTLLKKISSSDDNATDEIRSLLGNNLRVEGASNISNVQQLITDVSNGSLYKVTKITTDAEGKVTSISVSK